VSSKGFQNQGLSSRLTPPKGNINQEVNSQSKGFPNLRSSSHFRDLSASFGGDRGEKDQNKKIFINGSNIVFHHFAASGQGEDSRVATDISQKEDLFISQNNHSSRHSGQVFAHNSLGTGTTGSARLSQMHSRVSNRNQGHGFLETNETGNNYYNPAMISIAKTTGFPSQLHDNQKSGRKLKPHLLNK